MLHGLSCDFN